MRKAKSKPRRTGGKRAGVSEAMAEAALRKCNGIIAHAAKRLGVARQTLWDRVQASKHLQKVREQIDDEILDDVENLIVADMKRKKNMVTARWFAERKGKKRGYATKIENESRLSEADLEAVVSAFGGDLAKLRDARAALNPAAAGKP